MGAKLTLTGEATSSVFRRAQIELGVSAGVVLALAIGLWLISKTDVEPPRAHHV